MKEITLTRGQVAIVDDEDFERVNQHDWCALWNAHSHSFVAQGVGDVRGVGMHRFILDATGGVIVDHRDHNGLNNRRYNLRQCTIQQNNHNSRKLKQCSSRYKGVRWYGQLGKWQVTIQLDGKQHHIGYFDHESEAAIAYNEAALKYHGEFACLNNVELAGVLA